MRRTPPPLGKYTHRLMQRGESADDPILGIDGDEFVLVQLDITDSVAAVMDVPAH
jgi:hypothetical protein